MSGSMEMDPGVERAVRRAAQMAADLADQTRRVHEGLAEITGARVFDPASRRYNEALWNGAYSNGANHVRLEMEYADTVGANLADSVREMARGEETNAGLVARPGENLAE